VLAQDAKRLSAIAAQPAGVPPHLAGIPSCLHKYEPLFRTALAPVEPAEAQA